MRTRFSWVFDGFCLVLLGFTGFWRIFIRLFTWLHRSWAILIRDVLRPISTRLSEFPANCRGSSVVAPSTFPWILEEKKENESSSDRWSDASTSSSSGSTLLVKKKTKKKAKRLVNKTILILSSERGGWILNEPPAAQNPVNNSVKKKKKENKKKRKSKRPMTRRSCAAVTASQPTHRNYSYEAVTTLTLASISPDPSSRVVEAVATALAAPTAISSMTSFLANDCASPWKGPPNDAAPTPAHCHWSLP